MCFLAFLIYIDSHNNYIEMIAMLKKLYKLLSYSWKYGCIVARLALILLIGSYANNLSNKSIP